MAKMTDAGHRVMEVVIRSPGCDLEGVMSECSDLTWNQVFLEVDRLSRVGYLALKRENRCHYILWPRWEPVRPS
jgi:hypothetical protein